MVLEIAAEGLIARAERCYSLKDFEHSRELLDEASLLAAAPALRTNAVLLMAKLDFLSKNWEAALAGAQQILEGEPRNWDALKIRQKCWQYLTFASEDFADCRTLNELRPSALEHSDLIFKSIFLAETTPEMVYAEAQRWNTLYAAPLASKTVVFANVTETERRLRLGYVSPDFRNHAISKLLPCVFENHDPASFEVFAYSIKTQADEVTGYYRRTVKNFVELAADRYAIAKRVRADGIYILVDLAGHTMPLEGLLAFAMKPAPVQVSWMGVHATTGLQTMDYFLGDAHMRCPGTEHLFSEKVLLLPAMGRPRPCAFTLLCERLHHFRLLQ